MNPLCLVVLLVLSSSIQAQDFGFTNFPLNLTVQHGESLPLSWHDQDSYVNISLARFYWFGDGSEFHDYITIFNKADSLTWTPNASLSQGVYAFFISSPNRNSSESPFFSLISANATSPASAVASNGLSEAAKVGVGLGVPLGVLLLACVAYWIRRKSLSSKKRAPPSDAAGNFPATTQRAELAAESGVRELPGDTMQ